MDKAPKREDRRVTKTKAAICQALRELMNERSYESITITALSQRADIDRKTFYTHYRSIDDAFEDVVAQRLALVLEDVDMATFFDDLERNTLTILQATSRMAEEEKLLGADASPEAYERALRVFSRLLGKAVTEQSDADLTPREQEEFDLTVHYYTGGLLSLYRRWLESGSDLSLQDIAAIAYRNMVHGARGLKSGGADENAGRG